MTMYQPDPARLLPIVRSRKDTTMRIITLAAAALALTAYTLPANAGTSRSDCETVTTTSTTEYRTVDGELQSRQVDRTRQTCGDVHRLIRDRHPWRPAAVTS